MIASAYKGLGAHISFEAVAIMIPILPSSVSKFGTAAFQLHVNQSTWKLPIGIKYTVYISMETVWNCFMCVFR